MHIIFAAVLVYWVPLSEFYKGD